MINSKYIHSTYMYNFEIKSNFLKNLNLIFNLYQIKINKFFIITYMYVCSFNYKYNFKVFFLIALR